MRKRLAAIASGTGALALALTALVAVGSPAQAYTGTPPWVGNADDTLNVKGAVNIYDATGTQIFDGTDIQNFATWLGTTGTAPRAGANKASAQLAAPSHTQALVSTWSTNDIQTNYTWSPTPVSAPTFSPAADALVKLTTGAAIEDVATGVTLDGSLNYQNVLEIRVKDSGVGVVNDGGHYWRTIIEYNPTLAVSTFDGLAPGAWKQIYPAPPSKVTTTTTTPTAFVNGSVSSSTSSTAGDSVVFKTTVVPASGTLTGGTVKFFDGVQQIGSDVTVSGTVAAGTPVTVSSGATTSLTSTSHSVKATFTPSSGDAAGFTSSESTPLTFTVNAGVALPDATTTAISSTSPAGTATSSATVTVNVHVADTTNVATPVASGTVAVKLGATTIASGTVDASGNYSTQFVAGQFLSLGTNSLTAAYTGNTSFADSTTGSGTTYTVTLAAPANLVAPSISAARVGGTSTCTPGTWQAAFAFTYAWYQRASVSASWSQIGSAAVSPSLGAALVGHQVKCVVTAYNPTSASAESAVSTVAPGAASRNTVRPKIVGIAKVGKRLSVSRGTWVPAATTYQYVWKVGSTVVSRASSYVAAARYRNKAITVTVYAVRAGYLTGVASSAAVVIR